MAVTVIRMTMYGVKTAVSSPTSKTKLPVTELRFGDTDKPREEGYHTLGTFMCYATA